MDLLVLLAPPLSKCTSKANMFYRKSSENYA
jgi:hypothetical protein